MTQLSLVVLGLLFIGGCLTRVSAKSGTPRNLEEIFIGRCLSYQEVVNPDTFRSGKKKDCASLWRKFSQAWAGKDPCRIPPSNYEAFVNEAHHVFRSHKACLWSLLDTFVSNYADQGERMFHVALTLSGYVGFGNHWCGESGGGTNYHRCPDSNLTTCPEEAGRSFWKAVSVKYAADLNGTVTVFLNGSGLDPPYSPTSILGAYEIPQLKPSRVKMVDIIIIHAIGKSRRETCEHGSSIDKLKEELTQRQLKWQCHDNPLSVLHYLCIDHPDHKECKFDPSVSSSTYLTFSYLVVGFSVLLKTFLANEHTF